jgi:hypothetical protein
MWRGRLLLIFLWFASLATAAWAQDVLHEALWADVEREVRGRIQLGRPEQALEYLIEREPIFSGQQEYDYLLGVLALEHGQLNLAHAALERVVLVNPAHAGAWLDLAILSFRQGDLETASQLLDYIEQSFAPAPGLREQITQTKKRLAKAQRAEKWQLRLDIGRGFDRNANGGMQGAGLYLTPQGGAPVWVEYAPGFKPKKDGFWQTRWAGNYRLYDTEDQKIELSGDLLAKKHDRFSDYDIMDAGAGADYTRAFAAGGRLALMGQARRIEIGGKPFATRNLLGMAWGHTASAWESKGFAEHEWRTYQQPGTADTATPWLGAYLGWQDSRQRVGATLRWGKERAKAARAGGDTAKTELALQWQRQIARNWTLNSSVFWAQHRDEKGYNPLLSDGSRRWIERKALFGDLGWHFYPGWRLSMELQGLIDQSNLAISRQRDWQGMLVIRYNTN